MNTLKIVQRNYVAFSPKHQYLSSMVTGGSILTVSDSAAQYLSSKWINNYQFDYRRTLSMFMFGTFYYGIIARSVYSLYDVILGPKNAMVKAFMEIGPHAWMLFTPAFYYSTGIIKGYDTEYITNQLKNEYLTASTGTALYWTPVMFASFRYCTIHTRILWVASFSFIHKTALSWYSNRTRVKERMTMMNLTYDHKNLLQMS